MEYRSALLALATSCSRSCSVSKALLTRPLFPDPGYGTIEDMRNLMVSVAFVVSIQSTTSMDRGISPAHSRKWSPSYTASFVSESWRTVFEGKINAIDDAFLNYKLCGVQYGSAARSTIMLYMSSHSSLPFHPYQVPPEVPRTLSSPCPDPTELMPLVVLDGEYCCPPFEAFSPI